MSDVPSSCLIRPAELALRPACARGCRLRIGPSRQNVLVVPGYQGSGPTHWQTWLEAQLPCTRRADDIDWYRPVLADWVVSLLRTIDRAAEPLWIVAHSFGCLASVAAIARRRDKIAGAMLVAPADPERFTPTGLRPADSSPEESLAAVMPQTLLGIECSVVASRNDPWMAPDVSALWAARWGAKFTNIGAAGHINVDSGFGPWPQGLRFLEDLQQQGGFGRARCWN
ncbi:alpha/beta hydrolase [Telmatospirillum sp.]|uniref:RBBP9/YdeN family alpha/beta hydrolase n=1 Tax=Telmatospirillum sp. TaxID=2079197 RepID=UPI00284B7747|nr:alpha/beta hydrolase [Telmatospirillum sp.]MDR3440510.1 alpha/beta hydrolase [Telmatospirillum sp.]